MADISKITIESGTYDIKDTTARSSISTLSGNLTNLQNQINLIDTKKYIFIGDSYNTTDTPVGGTQIVPWSSLVKTYLGLSDSQYYSSGSSGAGWHVTGNKFITQLVDFNSIITNKDEITDIYVLGGINDNPLSPSDVYDEILYFADYAKEHFPNAMVTIGIISWATYTASKINLIKKMDYYASTVSKDNLRFISNAYTWYHIYNQYQDDGHPTENGSKRIAMNLANYIKGGVASNKVYYEGSIYKDNNTLGISSSQPTIGTMKQFLNGETVNLIINLDMLTNLSGNSIAPSTSAVYILGSVDNLFIRTLNDPLCIHHGHCWGYDTTSAKYLDMNYGLFIQENQLKIKFYYVDKDAGNITATCSVIVFDDIPILNIPVTFS